MFSRKKHDAPLDLQSFQAELAALIERAKADRRLHLKVIGQELERSAEAVQLEWAITTPVI
jgi:hypothetical protein